LVASAADVVRTQVKVVKVNAASRLVTRQERRAGVFFMMNGPPLLLPGARRLKWNFQH
jgi:hypothetical protein